ncbi:AzlC family ABC transporter permease [Pseudotabrizicola algicola]|uniref:Branched-chain amino acid ABC transporter permease n=1 Tax=Pseudotabrizicola algicola TaxID=2709381 RepID=A0A6B3RSH3_9RHOB|nr:AzlC family ABC transporter permease [Pseudotabrizicola algicola]NEX46069.1 branched-chain amino acid ABC transporter permease [Pseudotabrizicola algicola]
MTPIRSPFLRGCAASAPFVIVVVPFALLFGVVATEAGLNLLQVMLFSLSVFAGASQFAAVQLMQDQAPVLVVLATSLAVNLRMVMYSVAMTPHLGGARFGTRALMAYFLVDQSFAASQMEFERRPDQPLADKVAFFFGTVAPIAPLWFAASFAGAVVGEAIPPEYALDFAVPITFLAICAPMLRSIPHVVAAAVSIIAALLFAGLPYGTGLLLAAVLAMAAGAGAEVALTGKGQAGHED